MPTITLIAAVSDNGVIGSHNELPWYIPEDLQHFKQLTTGKTVVMGTKTFESIMKRLGKPLPNRTNVVLTRQEHPDLPEGVRVIHEPKEALELPAEDLMIIGGGQVYAQFIELADKLELTHVHQTVEGDIRFPEIDWSQWRKISDEPHDGFSFATYERA